MVNARFFNRRPDTSGMRSSAIVSMTPARSPITKPGRNPGRIFPTTAGIILTDCLTQNRPCGFVFAYFQEDGMPQMAARPGGEAHVAHQAGLEPLDPPGRCLGPRHLAKRTLGLNERRQLRRDARQFPVVEAAADFPNVYQLAIHVEPKYQAPKCDRLPRGWVNPPITASACRRDLIFSQELGRRPGRYLLAPSLATMPSRPALATASKEGQAACFNVVNKHQPRHGGNNLPKNLFVTNER
jgi:hypothetical protein